MKIPKDVKDAKKEISRRFLKNGMKGALEGRPYSLLLDEALKRANYNVHAVGVGRKITNGKPTKHPCVRIYVYQKLSQSLIQRRHLLPSEIDGIPTDIIESPPAYFACNPNPAAPVRPVIGGCSASNRDVTAGTLGALCRSLDPTDPPGAVFALSNNHVFASLNQAPVGYDLYQPSRGDNGSSATHFADLHRCVPLVGNNFPNKVDGAIGLLRPGVRFMPAICVIGPITGVQRATDGMLVRKFGRTTQYTEGRVVDESRDVVIPYTVGGMNFVATFEDQIGIDPIPPYREFGTQGDSGSLVVNKYKPLAVGLYFANPANGTSVANHIGDVLSQLRIALL